MAGSAEPSLRHCRGCSGYEKHIQNIRTDHVSDGQFAMPLAGCGNGCDQLGERCADSLWFQFQTAGR